MRFVRAIDRKVLRDLWHLRGPAVAISIVTACGIASFVSLRSMMYHLKSSQDSYYRNARFGHLFATVKRAPLALEGVLAGLPGVTAVQLRVADDVTLDVPGLGVPAVGHLVGIPTTHPLALNLVAILKGRTIAPGRGDEVLLSEGFANGNNLAPGDSLDAVIGGHWHRLRIAGIAQSPEFVYATRPGELFPDKRRYGVLWMDEDAVADAFGLSGAWNEASMTLAPGASEPDVIARVDRLLARYGSLGAYGRSQQMSDRFLTNEIDQNRTFAAVVPVIFLGVAAFLVNLVLSRLVVSQREQIGMLKAFGFGEVALGRHFTLLALGPMLPGAFGGCAVGLWAAGKFARIYEEYFRMPGAAFVPHASVLVVSVLITAIAAAAGGFAAMRRVWRLPPAESMRPETPARYRRGLAERLGLMQRLTPVWRMVVRSITRRPWRAALSVTGMGLGVAIVIVGSFAFDSLAVMRDVQFTRAQREDIAVSFAAPRPAAALQELSNLPGVLRVEATRETPVQVRHEQRARKVGLTCVVPGAELRRVVDMHGRVATAPEGGVFLSAALASLLVAHVGDTVQVEMLTGRRLVRDVRIAGTLDDLVGTAAYATPEEYQRMTGAGEAIDGAVLALDPLRRDSVFALLKRMPGVRSIGAREAMMRSFDEMVAGSFSITLFTLVVFAIGLALGVTYNIARIALTERSRDLASLRVLGFTRAEIAGMLFGEQRVLCGLAAPVGYGLGIGLSWLMIQALESDLFRLPLVVHVRTYAFATGVLLVSMLLASVLVRRRLDRLDLVAVLKTRE